MFVTFAVVCSLDGVSVFSQYLSRSHSQSWSPFPGNLNSLVGCYGERLLSVLSVSLLFARHSILSVCGHQAYLPCSSRLDFLSQLHICFLLFLPCRLFFSLNVVALIHTRLSISISMSIFVILLLRLPCCVHMFVTFAVVYSLDVLRVFSQFRSSSRSHSQSWSPLPGNLNSLVGFYGEPLLSVMSVLSLFSLLATRCDSNSVFAVHFHVPAASTFCHSSTFAFCCSFDAVLFQ